MSKAAEKFDVDELVKTFNQKFPVGSTVRWRSLNSDKCPYREYTVMCEATNHFGTPITWFREKTGMVCISAGFVDYDNYENHD